jgi:hypothetical protein
LVGCDTPAQQQCSTSPSPIPEAVPQYISGRTSYLRIRLAFHPYPQLIRAFCNRHRFGPPRAVRHASAWSWVAHAVSGLPDATVLRPIQTCVRYGSGCRCLNRATSGNSSGHSPKGTLSGDKPPPTAWKHTGSGSVSLPSPGYFSPFPHGTVRYRSCVVSSLGRWSPQLPTRFFVPGRTQEPTAMLASVPTRLSRSVVRCSKPLRERKTRRSLASGRTPW